MKILLDNNPLAPSNHAPQSFGEHRSQRPAWITPQYSSQLPDITAFRLQFDVAGASVARVHVSADERYILYLDGEYIGRGPERGSDKAWFYETYDLSLSSGSHTIVALVWQLGDIGPLAQVSLSGGFLLEAEGAHRALLSTISGRWEAKTVQGISFSMPERVGNGPYLVQPIQQTDGTAYPWDIELGDGEGWEPTVTRHEDFLFPFGVYGVHNLKPAMLPEQMSTLRHAGRVRHVADTTWDNPQFVLVDPEANISSDVIACQALLDDATEWVIPPHTQRQVIIDAGDYVCAYPVLQVSGGHDGCVTIGWAEALHLDASGEEKGQRDEIAGRTFIALCRDVLLLDGGMNRQFEPLWWRSGRYIELLIETTDQPLTINMFSLRETRYPLEMESQFQSSDTRLNDLTPVILRGLQMCAHETYMDCPYYEQLMYVGDTRLEALTTYAINSDDRLPRKAITLYNLSRLPDGLVQARYPSRNVQVIAPFSLWWVGMVYDYALWRGDRVFIVEMLAGVRAVLDGFLAYVNDDNLLQASSGWNFTDWTPEWKLGVPPDGFDGFSGVLNWHLIYTLGLAVQLEQWVGDPFTADRWRSWQGKLATASHKHFWDDQRGLFADDGSHTSFSEHTQSLALLSGQLSGEIYTRTADGLVNDKTLTPATIYFTHYLFETYYLLGQADAFFDRMDLWFSLATYGFKTTPEQPEPSRSDCHGWGAHPMYHYVASLLGIRSIGFGFSDVEIAPMVGHLSQLEGEMAHPSGIIRVTLRVDGDHIFGDITLPDGVNGIFRYAGEIVHLRSGRQTVEV
jgi:hypothetical protein